MAKVKPEEAETKEEIVTLTAVMDEKSAQEEKVNVPAEPQSQETIALGKWKASRLKYDLACIMGGKIIAAVSWKDEKGMDTEKIGLVVEVESMQGPNEHFTIWPVQSLEDITAPVTHLEINKTELA